MNNIRSTLATVWRIASPYFSSEDKWAGRGLLAAVIAIELAIVGINVLLTQWNNRFYNALQERNWDSFVSEIIYFCVLVAFFILLTRAFATEQTPGVVGFLRRRFKVLQGAKKLRVRRASGSALSQGRPLMSR